MATNHFIFHAANKKAPHALRTASMKRTLPERKKLFQTIQRIFHENNDPNSYNFEDLKKDCQIFMKIMTQIRIILKILKKIAKFS
jgi:hypothetical protein